MAFSLPRSAVCCENSGWVRRVTTYMASIPHTVGSMATMQSCQQIRSIIDRLPISIMRELMVLATDSAESLLMVSVSLETLLIVSPMLCASR